MRIDLKYLSNCDYLAIFCLNKELLTKEFFEADAFKHIILEKAVERFEKETTFRVGSILIYKGLCVSDDTVDNKYNGLVIKRGVLLEDDYNTNIEIEFNNSQTALYKALKLELEFDYEE